MEQLGHRESSDQGGEKGLPAELYTLYEIGSEIGRGPSSRVFDATDPRTGRKGTLKLLYPAAYSEAEQARIRREWIKQSALVESEKLLVPRASGEAGKALWLFRAKVDGVPLDVVLSDGAIVPESAMAMAKQLAEALDELHSAGLLHRDVKPEHVLVRASFAGPPRIALIDAGLAGSIETGTRYDVFGTPGYVSPEQITGKLVGFRSDLYALGCVFYEMVTGLPLFQADSVNELLILHATAPRPALPTGLPAEVVELIASLIAIDPRQRPLSAQHVIRTLEKFVPQNVSVSTSGSVVARRSNPAIAHNTVAVDREVEAVVNKEAIVKESELNLAEIQDAFAQSSLLGIAQDSAATNLRESKAPRPLRDETAGRFSYEQMKAEAAARAAGLPLPVPAQRISAPPVVPAASLPAINARGASSLAPSSATPRIGSVTQGSIPAINARGYASVAPPVPSVRTSEASPPPLPPISSAFLDSQQFENAQFESEELPAADYAGSLFDTRSTDEDIHEVEAAELSPETNRFAQPQFTRTEMASIGGWESAPTPMFVKSPASHEHTQEIDLEAVEAAAFDDATPIDDLGLERLTIPDISRSVSMAEIAATEKTKRGIFVLTVVIAFLFGTAVAIGATILYLRGTATPATPAVAAAPAAVTPAVVAAPAAPAVVAAPAPTQPAVAEVAAEPVAAAAEPAAAEPVAAAPVAEVVEAEPAAVAPVAAKTVTAKAVATKSARELKRERDAARRAEKQERLAAAAAAKAEKAAAKAAAAAAPAPRESTSVDDLLNTPAPKASKAAALVPTAPAAEPAAANDANSAFEQIRAEAKEHYAAGRYKEAAAGYERATTLNPSHAGAFAGLGASRTAMGDAKGAISAYIKAVQLAPSKSGYFAALGRAYATTGDVTNAERAYNKALTLDANNGAARQGLTEIGR